jgi:hypothetical protein
MSVLISCSCITWCEHVPLVLLLLLQAMRWLLSCCCALQGWMCGRYQQQGAPHCRRQSSRDMHTAQGGEQAGGLLMTVARFGVSPILQQERNSMHIAALFAALMLCGSWCAGGLLVAAVLMLGCSGPGCRGLQGAGGDGCKGVGANAAADGQQRAHHSSV